MCILQIFLYFINHNQFIGFHLLFTAFDQSNDVRSTQRKLDNKLVLVVKQKLGAREHWMLPVGIHTEGETMRQVRFVLFFCNLDFTL